MKLAVSNQVSTLSLSPILKQQVQYLEDMMRRTGKGHSSFQIANKQRGLKSSRFNTEAASDQPIAVTFTNNKDYVVLGNINSSSGEG